VPSAGVVPALDEREQLAPGMALRLQGGTGDQLAFERREGTLGHRVVVGVADGAGRRLDVRVHAALLELGIEVVAPRRSNRARPPLQDGRALHRCRRRWRMERLIAWFGNFPRLVVRYERRVEQYVAFMHVACFITAPRYL
jgi:hypothetical protein